MKKIIISISIILLVSISIVSLWLFTSKEKLKETYNNSNSKTIQENINEDLNKNNSTNETNKSDEVLNDDAITNNKETEQQSSNDSNNTIKNDNSNNNVANKNEENKQSSNTTQSNSKPSNNTQQEKPKVEEQPKTCTPKKFDFSFVRADFSSFEKCTEVGEKYRAVGYGYVCDSFQDDCFDTYYMLSLFIPNTSETFDYHTIPIPE